MTDSSTQHPRNSTGLILTPINGEPRVHDLHLAELLGFERPAKIRELIKRNETKLRKFNHLPALGRCIEIGNGANREVFEYYLDQQQAIFICMKSETSKAFDVQRDIVRVFDAYLDGDLQRVPAPQTKPHPARLAPVLVDADRLLRFLHRAGIKGNAAVIATDQGIREFHGISLLALTGQTHLISETQVLHFTPTELGQRIDVSGKAFNKLLQERGLQFRENDRWIPTSAGQPYAMVLDTGKRHSDGAPVEQIKWSADVIGIVSRMPVE